MSPQTKTAAAFYASPACAAAVASGKRIRLHGAAGFVSLVAEGQCFRISYWSEDRIQRPRPSSGTVYMTKEAGVRALVDCLLSRC